MGRPLGTSPQRASGDIPTRPPLFPQRPLVSVGDLDHRHRGPLLGTARVLPSWRPCIRGTAANGSRSNRPRTIRPLFHGSFFASRVQLYSPFLFFFSFFLLSIHLETSSHPLVSTRILNISICEACLSFIGSDIQNVMSLQRGQQPDKERNYDISFVTSQRGMKLPVVSGYVFVCKDKARKRFSCRTTNCRARLTLKSDGNGIYTDDTPVHTHPPHETTIASLQHKNKMREAAREHRTSLVTTRSIATSVRENDLTVRRLSTDLRFIRRFRQGNISPKTASEIIFNEQIVPFVLFHSQANEIIIFGDIDIVHAAASVSFISVDGTFSRCPQTHYQLVTCHAVCWNGFSFPFVFALLPDKKIRFVFSALYVDRFNYTTKIQRERLFENEFDSLL